MRKIFCIDIGNTRTHCATVAHDCGNFEVLNSSDYMSADFAEIFARENLLKKSCADSISWCSVVPKYSEKFVEKIPNGVDSMQLTHENSPMTLDIKIPSQLGQDRIADAIGAGIFLKAPYIVVDMGTAVTIDLVDAKGHYAGGVIAPGMHAFTDYLSERAAQLPKINPANADYDMSIGRDTVEAMSVGCVKGFCKLADGIISDIERDYFSGKSAFQKTIFTGGSISLLPKKWLADRKIEVNLAHLGLARSFIINKV